MQGTARMQWWARKSRSLYSSGGDDKYVRLLTGVTGILKETSGYDRVVGAPLHGAVQGGIPEDVTFKLTFKLEGWSQEKRLGWAWGT